MSLKLGECFQAQDDVLDCFGVPQVTGKVGTDIADGKCTWLLVEALRSATQEQRALLEVCSLCDYSLHVLTFATWDGMEVGAGDRQFKKAFCFISYEEIIIIII